MDPIGQIIAQFLALHEGVNSSELARRVGIHASYISEWRAGKRPTRLQERTRRKLQDAVGAGGAPESGDLVAYAREVLDTIERDALAVAASAHAALERLRAVH